MNDKLAPVICESLWKLLIAGSSVCLLYKGKIAEAQWVMLFLLAYLLERVIHRLDYKS